MTVRRATCPECECRIELRSEEHPTGTTLACPECETVLEVSSLAPALLSYANNRIRPGEGDPAH